MGKSKNRGPQAKPAASRPVRGRRAPAVSAEEPASIASAANAEAEGGPAPANDGAEENAHLSEESPVSDPVVTDGVGAAEAPEALEAASDAPAADEAEAEDAADESGTQASAVDDDAAEEAAPHSSTGLSTDDSDGAEGAPSVPGVELAGEGVEFQEGEADSTEEFLKGLVEAILFTADHPLSARDVARAARIDRRRAQELIELLAQETKNRGVRVIEVADGYAFRTNPAYGSPVRDFLAQKPVRLSRAQLETLAIIAYRQPVTRPEVDDIRGVDSGAVLKTLLERDLLRILGKKDEPGRPMIYGTTPQFLDLFSLKSLRDLPTLREFTELSEDSRAKFELELGEVAPEGPISFPEPSASTPPEGTADDEASDEPAPVSPGDEDVADDQEAPSAENAAAGDSDGEDREDDDSDDDDSDDDDSDDDDHSDDDDSDDDDEDDDEDDDDSDDDDDDDDSDDKAGRA